MPEIGSKVAEKTTDMSSDWILLIDPFKNLLNAYRMILEEEKYRVETGLNLKEAYQLLKQRRYSVIITEYPPPFESTNEMIQWVKKNAPETYIIVVTNASVDEKTYANLFAIGTDDFILKPYSPGRILVHIKRGLKQRELVLKVQELERRAALGPSAQETEKVTWDLTFFKRCLRQEIKKSQRHRHPFSLLLLQVPDGKEIGDRFDTFYTELVRIVKSHTREEDMVGKSNGEIGVILPETDQAGSEALAQRLSRLLISHPPFISDSLIGPHLRRLSFQSFTYPDQFSIPHPLNTILEDLNQENLNR